MNYTVTRKGALLPALWLTAVSAAAGLLVWLFFSLAAGLAAFFLLAVLSFALPFLHRLHYQVRVAPRELVADRGFFIRTLRRLPLRCVTGVICLSTPLGRLLDASVVAVYTSGTTLLLVGLPLADAEQLRVALTVGGGPA